ncbi:hypothetical protein [Lentibacillus cibarius]|uniref:Uncharacterized protein n=1 Tax=Lentibacillus cibarius TaxID=2583219 RepID=A0A5S3QI01_9BACI|nr:hypothetical protein [Lentibacillus cibarius]TMN20821.1 hypothetical protein FFL34_00870 [Lentibacillus cibarius]
MRQTNVMCEKCGGYLPLDNALFDEHEEVFFCEDDCLYEWADDHFESIVEQYKSFHVHAG